MPETASLNKADVFGLIKNSPFDPVFIKKFNSDEIYFNSSFQKLFNLKENESYSKIIEVLAGEEKNIKSLDEFIGIPLDYLAKPTCEINNTFGHFRIYIYHDFETSCSVVHVRDLVEIDNLTFQVEEYSGAFVESSVNLEFREIECHKQNIKLQLELKNRAMAEELLRQSMANLNRIIGEMIKTISNIGLIRDPYTGMHQFRVATLAREIASALDLNPERIQGIYVAGMLHDIGKISIPTEILSKPGVINELEMLLIKSHPKISAEILSTIDFPWPIKKIAYQHHERLDGSGYPDGIKGDDIMVDSQIVTVADVVEAISAYRPYRKSLGMDEALKHIREFRGVYYRTEIVDACLKLIEEDHFEFPDTII